MTATVIQGLRRLLGDSSKKQTNLLNGLRRPRMITPPGQIERWHFLHGSFLDEMFIAAFRGKDPDCKSLDFAKGPIGLPQIGRDGLTLPRPKDGKDWPYAPPYVFLSPGYRWTRCSTAAATSSRSSTSPGAPAGAKCMIDPRWCPEAARRCAAAKGMK